MNSDDCSEYSDENDLLTHHSLNSQQNQLNNQDNLLQSSHSPSISALNLNENEIEPSRLLEQTMITGDVSYF